MADLQATLQNFFSILNDDEDNKREILSDILKSTMVYEFLFKKISINSWNALSNSEKSALIDRYHDKVVKKYLAIILAHKNLKITNTSEGKNALMVSIADQDSNRKFSVQLVVRDNKVYDVIINGIGMVQAELSALKAYNESDNLLGLFKYM